LSPKGTNSKVDAKRLVYRRTAAVKKQFETMKETLEKPLNNMLDRTSTSPDLSKIKNGIGSK